MLVSSSTTTTTTTISNSCSLSFSSYGTVVVLLSVLGDLVVFWYSRQMDLYGEKENNLELETTPPTTPVTPGPLNSHLPPSHPELNANTTQNALEDFTPLYSPSERDYVES